jgi:hypothetical protein
MTKTKKLTMKNLFTSAIATSCLVAFTSVAQARSTYDGSWELLFVTQRGACDPTYNFSVNMTDGVVTHPNLVKFRGHVARSGAVSASVTVPDKYASGSGRLSRHSGRGTWSGFFGRRALLGILDRPAELTNLLAILRSETEFSCEDSNH